MLRVFGALLFVIGLFLGGAWLFRNARQLRFNRGTAPKLRVLESRSLGGRHALFVVAYQDETLLLSSSPAGINLLTHLPSSPESAEESSGPSGPATSFAQALAGKLLLAGKAGGKVAQ
jgi:flagellar biogenesis protein FliO